MAKKCKPEQLPDVIKAILDEYADDIIGNMPEITERIGKDGVKAVKAGAKANFNGHRYAAGWKLDVDHQRLYTTATIYNAKLPGLPHLLEHGHAMRNGGRVSGKAHIAPVEKTLITKFEKEVENELK